MEMVHSTLNLRSHVNTHFDTSSLKREWQYLIIVRSYAIPAVWTLRYTLGTEMRQTIGSNGIANSPPAWMRMAAMSL